MKMEMEPRLYWPERKVYLFGMLAFFPSDIEGKELRAAKLRHYFDEDALEAEMRTYERDGYFTVIMSSNNTFSLTGINSHRFREELAAYLDKVKLELPNDKREQIWSAAAKQSKLRGYSPTISWQDIYGDTTRYQYTPPFWELIFAPALAGRVKLTEIGYTKTVPMAKELLPFYERPFAMFDITDKVLQKSVAKSHGAIRHKATLKLTDQKLWLILGGQHHLVRRYQGKNGNAYRTASALHDGKRPLAKDDLNLKTDTKSELKDLLSNAGLKGVLRDLFIETGYDEKRHRPTLALKRSIEADDEEYELLLEYVKSISTRSE